MTELEKATQAYCQEHNDDCFEAIGDECPFIGKAFKAGANWQYEQFEKERLKHCDELTAEQAQIESDFVVQHLEKYNRTPTFIDAIEYGRKMMIEKAVEWFENNLSQEVSIISGGYVHINFENSIKEFRKALEE